MIKLVAFASAAAIAVTGALRSSLSSSPAFVTPVAPMLAPSLEPDLVLRGALARAGLGPEELCAAGVAPGEVAALISRAAGHDVVAQDRLPAADTALGEARRSVRDLEAAIRGGDREPATLQALDQARQSSAAAEDAVNAHLQARFAEATGSLEASVASCLDCFRENRAHRRLPLEFLVHTRTPAEWADIRDCLTHERVCTRRGDPTDPDIMSALAAARADERVAGARARLEANRSAVESAWMAASTVQ